MLNSQLPTKILFISKSIESSSTRYRALQFYPYLERHDFSPTHSQISGGILSVIKTLGLASKADTVIVLRKTFPFVLTWLLRLVSKKLIFDLDDAIFCSTDGSSSATRKKRFKNIVMLSDHVFAGNKFLAKNTLLFNKSVTVIPTCLNVKKYDITVDKPKDHIDLVWIGSTSTSKYLLNILPILELAVKEQPKLRLKIIADFSLTDAKINTLNIPWNEETEAEELASSHIGIAPMIENDWTRGKCALKVLQYMASKLPVISSNVGVNSEVIHAGKTGYLVSTTNEWLNAIEQLSTDIEKQKRMGIAGQNKVKRLYDEQVIFNRALPILKL
ncbi:MAG: hypothetical protein CL866_07300 [Cycloclasticus sp.]|nr:hypothetical protein [Cycloclasticus sp.]MBG96651.1 hypothetical protein [Cycloclasticus sp.]HAI97220.1 hypothetical protein [Methylococcaceae bacterium]